MTSETSNMNTVEQQLVKLGARSRIWLMTPSSGHLFVGNMNPAGKSREQVVATEFRCSGTLYPFCENGSHHRNISSTLDRTELDRSIAERETRWSREGIVWQSFATAL